MNKITDPTLFEIARKDVEEQWAALGVHDGGPVGPVMPYTMKTRNAKGKLEEEPVALAMVSVPDKAKARGKARKLVEELKLDPSLNGEDRDFVQTAERAEILCYAIREYDPKKGDKQEFPIRFANAADLFAAMGPGAEVKLGPVWAAWDHWVTMNDPRYGELSDDELVAVIAKIAERGSPDPLADIGGHDAHACIVRMAKLASRFLIEKSSQPRPST